MEENYVAKFFEGKCVCGKELIREDVVRKDTNEIGGRCSCGWFSILKEKVCQKFDWKEAYNVR